MKKYIIVAIIVFIAFTITLLVGLSFYVGSGTGQVIFINNSTQVVISGQIEVSNQILTFESLKPNERKVMTFKVTKDSHYKVMVELESGKTQTAEIGYVSRGFDFEETILLTDDGISLSKDRKVNKPVR